MATTTNYSIFYPIQSDSVAPLHTAFSTLADSVDSAMTTYLKPLVDNIDGYTYTVPDVGSMNAIASPPAGSTAFITADKSRYYRNGSAWVPIYVPWTTYSPLVSTNGTSPITEIAVTDAGKYMVSNNRVYVTVKASFTAAPSAMTAVYVGFPTSLPSSTIVDQFMPIGQGAFNKAGVIYPAHIYHSSTTYCQAMYQSGTTAKNFAKTAKNDAPAAFATGNTFTFSFSYPL